MNKLKSPSIVRSADGLRLTWTFSSLNGHSPLGDYSTEQGHLPNSACSKHLFSVKILKRPISGQKADLKSKKSAEIEKLFSIVLNYPNQKPTCLAREVSNRSNGPQSFQWVSGWTVRAASLRATSMTEPDRLIAEQHDHLSWFFVERDSLQKSCPRERGLFMNFEIVEIEASENSRGTFRTFRFFTSN